MPVFISYSHVDKNFVDVLAANIVANRGSVWLDRWELKIGDSLVQKIQEAIATSSALLVVLSKASVDSEWCKKELSAGLIRELEEKRVVVLPVLKEDCAIPLFLRDKVYADFRTNADDGLASIMDGIATVTNRDQSRIEKSEYTVDWSQSWGGDNSGLFHLRYTLVQSMVTAPITILTIISVSCDRAATNRVKRLSEADLDWYARDEIAQLLRAYSYDHNVTLLLEDAVEKFHDFKMIKNSPKRTYNVMISSRRMGSDTGKLQLVQISNYLNDVMEHTINATRQMTTAEAAKLVEVLSY